MEYLAIVRIEAEMLLAPGSNVSQSEFDDIVLPLQWLSRFETDRLEELVSMLAAQKRRLAMICNVNND